VSTSIKNNQYLPVIGITLGDSNGIGPEILIQALDQKGWKYPFQPVVYGDSSLLNDLVKECGSDLRFEPVQTIQEAKAFKKDVIPVLQGSSQSIPYRPGVLDPAAGANAAIWIEEATHHALAKEIDGLVTCPVNKDGMMQGGCPYAGDTPMLAALTNTSVCYMSLFAEHMRIVHITAHLSMKDAVATVKKDRIFDAIKVSFNTLKQMGFKEPRIAVAGLNPHAGEMGAFGNEEAFEIAPAVDLATKDGIVCTGPYSPDTVFSKMAEGEFDLVVAMYHDQGHIPFKLVAMDEGVHVTLGLPFVRTSPDHGTAFDIAGKGQARPDSMYAALQLAAQWARFSSSPSKVVP
jgi:4-hydroxythreonine-4-phosphate dehydrogenase